MYFMFCARICPGCWLLTKRDRDKAGEIDDEGGEQEN